MRKVGLGIAGAIVLAAIAIPQLGRDTPAEQGLCPIVPQAWEEASLPVWPAPSAGDLVPELPDGMCTLPTHPDLVGLLHEAAVMASGTEAVALGLVHEQGEVPVSFSVVRVKEATPGLEDGMVWDGPVTRVGSIDVGWAAAGDMVAAFWLNEREVVTLAASSPQRAAEVVGAWLGEGSAATVVVPAGLPEPFDVPAAIVAGLPVDGLPDGYTALNVNPIMFMQSDLADVVTIFDEPIQAMGAALIIHDGELLATALGWSGPSEVFGTTPSEIRAMVEAQPSSSRVVSGVIDDGIDIVLVGSDQDVERLASSWQAALG